MSMIVRFEDLVLGPYGSEDDAKDALAFVEGLDGVWNRLIEVDGDLVLEHRDPNDGLGWNPETKCRYQYKVIGNHVLTRRLPPEGVGDAWEDIGIPPWDLVRGVTVSRWNTLRDFVRVVSCVEEDLEVVDTESVGEALVLYREDGRTLVRYDSIEGPRTVWLDDGECHPLD